MLMKATNETFNTCSMKADSVIWSASRTLASLITPYTTSIPLDITDLVFSNTTEITSFDEIKAALLTKNTIGMVYLLALHTIAYWY